MFVICECIDNPGAGEARAAALNAPRGSLYIVEVEDVQGARDFVDGDPFVAAGVFSGVQYKQFKPTINNLG